jgi:hypothetical protein
MDFGEWMSKLPLWAVFALTLAICIGAVEAGTTLARISLRQKKEKEPEAPLGSLVGAVLGLLAFILAFTFGMTASRFDARRQLVLQEANAIGTTYLRAGLLPPTQGLEVRRLLREYADVRLNVTAGNVQEALNKSEDIHGRLWAQAKALVQTDMDSELRSLFIAGLNEVIDLHHGRPDRRSLHAFSAPTRFGGPPRLQDRGPRPAICRPFRAESARCHHPDHGSPAIMPP